MSTHPEAPSFPVLGILGGGQLGRMMAFEAIRMGIGVRFLAPEAAGPMQGLGESIVDDWRDPGVLRRFAEGCTAITVESEWAPADEAAEALGGSVPVWPSPTTLNIIRHKGRQKTHLVNAGLPVPEFALCRTLDEALEAAAEYGYPVVVKQFKRSYDGYGNATAHSDEDVKGAWEDLSAEDGLMVERFVPFEEELSVLVARRPNGQHVVYPVAYTEQRDHRCHAVEVPAEIDSAAAAEARRVALAAVDSVGGVGLTAVELFHAGEGRILINELAPRPHNTGHYSIEGSHTSQFENHVRAVLDLPLGVPGLRDPVAVMVNVLGRREGDVRAAGLSDALSVPGAGVHIYGKPDVRVNRKMGHVTVTGHDRSEVRSRAEKAASLIHL